MSREALVARTRSLLEAVAFTALDDEASSAMEARLAQIESELQQTRLAAVPRTSFEDAVGDPSYVWQWGNPALPEVRMSFDGTAAEARFDRGLSAVHAGPPGLVHGGVSALILDAVLASLVQFHGISSVTASLTTTFCAPTPIDTPFIVRGHLDEIGDRKVFASGAIVVDGVESVQASGLFIRIASYRA